MEFRSSKSYVGVLATICFWMSRYTRTYMYMYYLYLDTDAVLCLRGCKKDKAAVLIQYVYSYSTFAFTCLHAYPDVRPSTEYPDTVLPVHVLIRLHVPTGDGVGAQQGPVYHTSALSFQRNTFYQPGRANGPT